VVADALLQAVKLGQVDRHDPNLLLLVDKSERAHTLYSTAITIGEQAITRKREDPQAADDLAIRAIQTMSQAQNLIAANRAYLVDQWKHLVISRPCTPMIETPPLMLLDRIVCFLWPRKTYQRVFQPVVSDAIIEWEAAHVAGNKKLAWYIKNVRSRWIILFHIAMQAPMSILSVLQKLFKLGM
jgi:hypothetical protein